MEVIIGAQAIINTLGYLAVIWAFRMSFRDATSPTWWFALGFANLAGAIILRGLYWDFTLPLMRYYHPDLAVWWVDLVDGRAINFFFNAQKTFSFFCALKCRQLLIEEKERNNWPWYQAWRHPVKDRRWPW